MADTFYPSYKNFQMDIESYLIHLGCREKSDDGMVTFRGYDDALMLMFQRYLEQNALEPLVEHFRNWNWEVGYNKYLLDLTNALLSSKNWLLLQRLWDGVITKQRRLYNQMWKNEKDAPGTLSSNQFQKTKELLLESLNRVIDFAEDIGGPDDMDKYVQMMKRIDRGNKA